LVGKVFRETDALLTPVRELAACLSRYTKELPDSALLLIDMKPAITGLFVLHRKAKELFGKSAPTGGQEYHPLADAFFRNDDRREMSERIQQTITSARDTLHGGNTEHCNPANLDEIKNRKDGSFQVPFNQPYTDLALADLLVAHGAPDQAVSVLAEWLAGQEELEKPPKSSSRKPDEDIYHMPKWFKIRVLGKLQAILGDMTRKQARAFKDVLEAYRVAFADYVGSGEKAVLLEQLPQLCKDRQLSRQQRRSAYVLVGTEIDALRTELNFVPEVTSFEVLVRLGKRAEFLTHQNTDCFPDDSPQVFTPEYKKASVAEGQVIGGIVALAAADRMRAIGTSSGERERAITLQKQGETWLRDGYAELHPIWNQDRGEQSKKPLPDRIFGQSQWEASADLASRVIARLH
jgi:hypothetical protein